jgi:dienelactone hydrolase/uncharacterized protein (DUF2141 family)
MKLAAWALAGGLILASGAEAATVSVAFEGVRSANGNVLVSLCPDPAAFMKACAGKQGFAKAAAGETVVTVQDVPPGRYALSAFHDENGDFRAEIPPEGYAFGNDAPYPPSFDAAAVQVAGDQRVTVHMKYLAGASPASAGGSHGVAPPAGVTRIDLRQGGLYGELYLPAAGGGRRPGVVLFGGSEGGLDTISGMAIDFAKQGYAALALAYWKEQGLPQTLELIPLEYFDKAVAWMKARPEVAPGGVGAMGWSRGSEAVLLLGSRNPDVKAVVAVAPSGIVWAGINYGTGPLKSAWTVGGQPLPYVPPDGTVYRPDSMKDMFIKALPEAARRPETQIPIEKINGSILLLSGGEDHLWPSRQMAEQMMARLKAKGFAHPYAHLTYDGAGHVIFVGAPDGAMGKVMGQPSAMLGGSEEADAKAWADEWPKVLDFYAKALKGAR